MLFCLMLPKHKYIILFDGVCNLCNNSVNFIIKRDKQNYFLFASLQSDAAKKILLQLNAKNYLNSLDSVLLIKDNVIYTKSSAALYILKNLNFPYSVFFIFIIFPKFFRDFFYDIIAKNRYKWFGKKDTCMIPTKKILDKFIE